MSKSIHDSNSFSFSRRYFNWRKKIIEDDHDYDEILNSNNSLYISYGHEDSIRKDDDHHVELGSCRIKPEEVMRSQRKKLNFPSVSKLRSALTVFTKSRITYSSGLGSKVIGTLFGYRRGHVHFAFQEHPKLTPAFMIELATPTNVLVREMASGLVRIALECEKKAYTDKRKAPKKLLEEPLWRTYCNGKKCGYAMRRECGPDELKILKAIEPISMGAGVIPGNGVIGSEEKEVMYMRAKFERVVGSKDSEAFYMMNPDGSGCPELSVYLLRV